MTEIVKHIQSSANLVSKIKEIFQVFHHKIAFFILRLMGDSMPDQLINELNNCINVFCDLKHHIQVWESSNRHCIETFLQVPPVNIQSIFSLQDEMDKIQKSLHLLKSQEILIAKEKEDLNKEFVEVFYQGPLNSCDFEILSKTGNTLKYKGAAINWVECSTKSVIEFISKEELKKLIPIQEYTRQVSMEKYQAKLVECQSSIESLANQLYEGKKNFSHYQENQNMLSILKAILEDQFFRNKISNQIINNIPKTSDQDWIHFFKTFLLISSELAVEFFQIINKIEEGILKDFQNFKEIMGNEELKKELKLTDEDQLIYSDMIKAEKHEIIEITKGFEKMTCKLPLSIENNNTTSCHVCQTSIDFKQFPMFCKVCDLWFCWLCSRKKNSSKIGTKSLIHPHNLALATEDNKETIKTISKEKFGDSNKTFEFESYNHKAFCDICGENINFCYRWICLQCKMENNPSFFDMCDLCKGFEIAKFDLPILSKIEEVFTQKNHTKDHVFLRVCFGNGEYYKY